MAKPADLKPGDRIDAPGVTAMTIIAEPFVDIGEDTARRFGVDYRPDDDRVHVDVEIVNVNADMDGLAAAAGAVDSQFLSLRPLTYRLYFRPDTDVQVTR
jgi:hypothetical protein